MSRTAHLGIGIGIVLLCVLWFMFGAFMFFALAVSKEGSPGASIYDFSFIKLYMFFGAGLLCGLWLAFLSFRRASRAPRLDLQAERSAPLAPPKQHDELATPDERLAHLVKKREK